MSEENPRECAEPAEPPVPPEPPEPAEPPVQAPLEKTSDYYRVHEDLPVRFNNPAWFRGYRTKEPASVYRTSNQVYGSRAPTVHEMPTTSSYWNVPEQFFQRLHGEEHRDGPRQPHHLLRPAELPPQLQRQQAVHLQ
ncbi:piercer of microtubule wall 1 protein isoform 2-T2 [Molossus nigricans]